jgi:hypothetical protein
MMGILQNAEYRYFKIPSTQYNISTPLISISVSIAYGQEYGGLHGQSTMQIAERVDASELSDGGEARVDTTCCS